ncbi:MAG: glycosyltransferase family 4 protein [Candidatus Delongbacteria bacterium]|jgi:galacturonosyltransferase|nr:glycosyltransferase family 4 protein [Candidatus Delongbacteria bacterium]
MKNKILILTNHVSGLYIARYELIQKLLNNNCAVFISTPQNDANEYVITLCQLGVTHFVTPIDRRGISIKKDIVLIKKYKEIIKNVNPDIILTYTIKPNIFGNYAAKSFAIPVISNITGIGSMLYKGRFKLIFRYLYKYACSKSRLVFFQNAANLEFFVTNKLVDPQKTVLIPGSGVNLDKFQPQKKTFNDGKIRFLFIGRLMKEKGIQEFLQTADIVTRKYPNTVFQIVGSLEENKYKQLIVARKNIEFLGFSNDVRVQIRESDCIVNPSYHEGMSNVLLEGAAMSKPLLASNIPGCKEIVNDGVNGFLFESKNAKDMEDKIVKFIELSDEEKVIMGKNSRIKVEKKFDRNIVVDEYIKAIKRNN